MDNYKIQIVLKKIGRLLNYTDNSRKSDEGCDKIQNPFMMYFWPTRKRLLQQLTKLNIADWLWQHLGVE